MKRVVELNGCWRFAPTLDQRPWNNHNITQSSLPLYASPELCRRDWERVSVPGVWQRYAEKYSIYEGVCWYCREFALDSLDGVDAARLRFEGVNYRADVYLNGIPAGCHESGYTEFFLDVSDMLRAGENFIAVRVDNRPLIMKWPNDWGYFNYGGIHRGVSLQLFGGDYIDALETTPELDPVTGDGLLHLRGSVCGKGPVVVALDGRVDELRPVSGRFDAVLRYPGVSPWSPESPSLSRLTVSIGGCTQLDCAVGFRHLEARGGRVLLNGRETRLNGCCYVFDSPESGLVMTREQLMADLAEMKAANVNAIRTHYPMDEKFYELCDEMGFLVWIEPNVYCCKPAAEETGTFFSRPDSVETARGMMREMISSARRFAGVAFYGIGNECNVEHPEAMPFFRELSAIARAADPTRLIGFAALYGLTGEIPDIVDVLGINSYFGWYDRISAINRFERIEPQNGSVRVDAVELSGFHALMEDVFGRIPSDMPVLLTEFGGDSIPGCFSSANDLWSENYHAAVVSSMIAASREYDNISGTFVFAFTDYLDPSKPRNGFWREQNLKGMLTFNRDRKLPFYALRDAYAK